MRIDRVMKGNRVDRLIDSPLLSPDLPGGGGLLGLRLSEPPTIPVLHGSRITLKCILQHSSQGTETRRSNTGSLCYCKTNW